jgi:RNA polymerase sigma-70 factor (ECF subfamily)
MSDLPLVHRLLAGDEPAFESFFADYFPRLYRFALTRLGGDADAAEEVTQLTLIRAVHKLQTYRGEAALFTWLCTFCRYEVAGWVERSGRTAEMGLVEDQSAVRGALEGVASLSGDPEMVFRRRELSRLVQVTLDHLPSQYGNALEWRYIEGLSVSEIADRLGLGYKAAESLLSRARVAFRQGFTEVVGTL